jgi:hypothetical protein
MVEEQANPQSEAREELAADAKTGMLEGRRKKEEAGKQDSGKRILDGCRVR